MGLAPLNYHSVVETPETKETTVKQPATENPAKQQQAETKETRVVKSDSGAGAKPRTKTVSTSHETNLNVLIIVAGGLAWFLFR